MTKFRTIVTSLLVILMLALGSVAGAQDTFCGALSADDCALLTAAGENLPGSSAFNLDTDLSITAEGETIDVVVGLSGSYIVDPAAAADIQAFGERFNNPAFAADPASQLTLDDVTSFLNTLFTSLDGSLTINATLPPEAGLPISTVDLWLVDGIGYIDLAPFQMFDPSFDGVYGLDLTEALGMAMGFVTPEDFAAALEGAGTVDAESAEELSDPAIVGEFVSLERIGDETVEGANVAVFQSTVDLATALQSEAVRQAIVDQVVADGTATAEEAGGVVDAIVAGVGSSNVVVTQRVGTDNGYLYSSNIVLDMNLDTDSIAAATGETGAGIVVVQGTIDFARTSVDAVSSIELPAGATVVPLEELMGGGM